MPTPVELARLTEQFDTAQWYDFLDELDAVTRRRRQREGEPDPPPGTDRDTLAAWIAQKHFLIDSGIRGIWYLPQEAPAEEIRLLEVNNRLAGPASGSVEAVDFVLDIHGCPFQLLVADITSDELEQIREGHLTLSEGWTLDGNTVWRRRA